VLARSLLTIGPKQKRAPVSSCLVERTNLSSTRSAASETPALPGDPVAQLALVAHEIDFCVLERAGTRAALNETDEMDENEASRTGDGRAQPSLLPFVHLDTDAGVAAGFRNPCARSPQVGVPCDGRGLSYCHNTRLGAW
jgi:hypothetical protein